MADGTLRPGQLFALSLPHPLIDGERARLVVGACARHLVTSHGVRTLAPHHRSYRGVYTGGPRERDGRGA